MYYDASTDNTFKLFCDTQTAPTTTVDESATGYALANLNIAGLTTTGNVGIGTSSPSSFSGDGNDLVVGTTSGNNGISIISATDGTANLYFGDTVTTGGGSRRGQIVYDHTTDSMRFATSVTEHMRIDSSGSVAIGQTTAPQKLTVAGNITVTGTTGIQIATLSRVSDAGRFELRDSGGNTKVQINASGNSYFNATSANVGIGTSSPSQKLDVQGTILVNNEIQFINATTRIFRSSDDLRLRTGSSDRMTVTSTGNVGIGTTSPNTTLEVVGENVRLRDASSGTYFQAIDTDGSHNAGYFMRSGSNNWYNLVDTSGRYQIYDGDAAAIRVLVDGTGNVGIGTTSPSGAKLHVAGGVKATDLIAHDSTGINLQTDEGTKRLVVADSGNVGIGTTSPARTFHVLSSNYAVARLERTGAGGGVSLEFRNGDGNLWQVSNDGDEAFRLYYAGSAERLELSSSGALRLNDAYTFPTADGSNGQALITDGSGNITFGSVSAGAASSMVDADGDTKIQVEETSDDDIIRFDTAGSQRMIIDDQGRVGINAASLSKTLTVGGTFQATGEAFFSHFDNTTSSSRMRDNLRLNFGTARTFAILGNSTNMHIRNSSTDVMTFDTSNRVGIGTSTPSFTTGSGLEIERAGAATLRLEDTGSGGKPFEIYSDDGEGYVVNGIGSGMPMIFKTVNAERMRIDTSGAVLIHPNNATRGLKITSTTTGTAGDTTTYDTIAAGFGRHVFKTDGTERVRIDQSGKIKAQTSGGYYLTESTTDAFSITTNGANGYLAITDEYNSSERLRITQTGSLLVGKTSSGISNSGFEVGQSGQINVTQAGAVVGRFNRKTSDGSILELQKNGTTVGEIGSEGGDSLYISGPTSTSSGLRFHPSAGNILPVRNRVTIDSTIDLGSSARRFKDLHLSAAANIGHASIQTNSTTTSATTQVAIDTMAAATFRSAKYTIQVTNSTDSTYHVTEILLIHDGTTPAITEYGTIFTGSAEATFDADISSGNVRLLATPATTDSMTFKVVRHCITV